MLHLIVQDIISPFDQVKISNQTSGKESENGPEGSIRAGILALSMNYLSKDGSVVLSRKEGWFHVGSLGYCDDNSRLFDVGRIKDLIKIQSLLCLLNLNKFCFVMT